MKITWPDCSPPRLYEFRRISRRHRGVADLGANQTHAGVAQRQLESEVAHHGGDDCVAVQPAFGGKLDAEQRHHVVAVPDFAALVDKHHAIAVTVERYTDVAVFAQNGFANRREVRRAAIQIDILPSGSAPIATTSAPNSSSASGPTL